MKKAHILIVLFAAALLAASFPYLSEARKSIFTERLGDMTLMRYETGEVAAKEISNVYGLKDIPLAKGYTALYSGRNGTMSVFVSEAPDHNTANDAFNSMSSALGLSGPHANHQYSGDVGSSFEVRERSAITEEEISKPVKVDFLEITKPDVFMMKDGNKYIYYYLKMDYKNGRVFWITFDYPDVGYHRAMVMQAIQKI